MRVMRLRNACPFCYKNRGESSADPSSIRRGSYRRKFDGRKIQRFQCRTCNKTFSSITDTPTWRQQKPFINDKLVFKLCSGLSQRRAARELSVDQKTVARRLVFLAGISRKLNAEHLAHRPPVYDVRFDDMESSIHTKLKPVSISMLVEQGSREILAIRVGSMPAKGQLAAKSLKKYGPRKDERPTARRDVLLVGAKIGVSGLLIKTDKCPQYPALIRSSIPGAVHTTVKGRRGSVVGQGELKKIGFDPLFSFNHTAAMARANINRLFRKTWCTSKRQDRLQDHLDIYMWFHNNYLLRNPASKKPPAKMPQMRLRP